MTGQSANRLLAFLNSIVALAVPHAGALAGADVGRPAPPLLVRQLDGHVLDMVALRGKVVVLNFWTTWCAPCRAEMPALDAFYRRHRREGLAVVGVSADDAHDRAQVLKVMRPFAFPAALLHDVKVNGYDAPPALPLSYVIDRSGVVRAVLTPLKTAITENSLTAIVTPLLAERGAGPGAP